MIKLLKNVDRVGVVGDVVTVDRWVRRSLISTGRAVAYSPKVEAEISAKVEEARVDLESKVVEVKASKPVKRKYAKKKV